MIRRKWLGGNWKCNASKHFVTELIGKFNNAKFKSPTLDVVIFPPSLYVEHTLRELKTPVFDVGVQNVSQPKNGAFTGELSAAMLKDYGLKWSLVGHSERRHIFKEDDKDVLTKINVLQNENLNSVVCVGETLEEFEQGFTEKVLDRQLGAFVTHVKNWDNVVIAYEPVWAIGTGKVATPDIVTHNHHYIRESIRTLVGDVADKVRVVYGGSVNAENCMELAKCDGVDGFLVGGASLKVEFLDIMKALE